MAKTCWVAFALVELLCGLLAFALVAAGAGRCLKSGYKYADGTDNCKYDVRLSVEMWSEKNFDVQTNLQGQYYVLGTAFLLCVFNVMSLFVTLSSPYYTLKISSAVAMLLALINGALEVYYTVATIQAHTIISWTIAAALFWALVLMYIVNVLQAASSSPTIVYN